MPILLLMMSENRRQRQRRRKFQRKLMNILLSSIFGVLMLVLGIAIGMSVAGGVHTAEEEPATSASASSPLDPIGTGKADEEDQTVDNPAAQNSSVEEPAVVVVDEPNEADKILNSMNLSQKIYQLFLVPPENLIGVYRPVEEAEDRLLKALEKYPVGGVILFPENILTPDQTLNLIDGMQAASDIGLFIAVDEEGGKVARLGNNPAMNTTAFDNMSVIGSSGNPKDAFSVYETIGKDLKKYHFNLNLAPVSDVFSNPSNTVMKERSFGSDPVMVGKFVSEAVKGLHQNGVMCSLKHFPGIGDIATDPHDGKALNEKTMDELRECEVVPFVDGIAAGADMVMMGHLTTPNACSEEKVPATLSHELMTDLLRNELGFEGVIITDSLQMKAITSYYDSGPAAVKALKAGADIILMPAQMQSAYEAIYTAVENGEISEERIDESVKRILELKLKYQIFS